MINTDCGTCPFADKCYMKYKFQRLPRSEGGLGLCPKVEIGWASETCKACHFTGKVGSRGGAKIRNCRTCKLLPDEPIVQNIKGRKKNCPFMEQVIKERALGERMKAVCEMQVIELQEVDHHGSCRTHQGMLEKNHD